MKTSSCPQCSADLFGDYSQCYVCGWGKNSSAGPSNGTPAVQQNSIPAPALLPLPTGPDIVPTQATFSANTPNLPEQAAQVMQSEVEPPAAAVVSDILSNPYGFLAEPAQEAPTVHSSRKRILNALAGFVALIVLLPLIGLAYIQIHAKSILQTGDKQIRNSQYANAVQTFNRAPKNWVWPATHHQLIIDAADAARWNKAALAVKQAREAMIFGNENLAIKLLSSVPKDYPDYNTVKALEKEARQRAIDPTLTVNQDPLNPPAADAPAQPAPVGTPVSQPAPAHAVARASKPVPVAKPAPKPTPTPAPAPAPAPTPAPGPSLVVMQRLFWGTSSQWGSDGDHFYTTNPTEYNSGRDSVSNFSGYKLENPPLGSVYSAAGVAGTVPLYRYWQSKNTDHTYSTDASSYQSPYGGTGYTRQLIAGYVGSWTGSSCTAGTKPVWELYSYQFSDTFYTASAADRDAAIKNYGYTNGNGDIAFCVW